MTTNTPDAHRFEDRLLTAILDDYDNLTAQPSSGRPSPLHPSSHPRQIRRMVPAMAAIAAAVAVAGVAVADGHGHAPPKVAIQPGRPVTKSAGPVMDLASYRLRLPGDYRLTATASCPVSGVGFMSPGPVQAGGQTFQADVPGYASGMVAAANAEGACLTAVLAPAYTPTAANPDPEAGRFENAPEVQVGPYEGRAGTWTAVAKPSGTASQEAALYVEIPLAGGQTQDLAVSSYGLSESALISLVADGLSVAGS